MQNGPFLVLSNSKGPTQKKHSTARYHEQCCASMYLSFCHAAEEIVDALEFVCQCLEQCGQLGIVQDLRQCLGDLV